MRVKHLSNRENSAGKWSMGPGPPASKEPGAFRGVAVLHAGVFKCRSSGETGSHRTVAWVNRQLCWSVAQSYLLVLLVLSSRNASLFR